MTYPVWDGSGWEGLAVPVLGEERLVLPGVGILAYADPDRSLLLLQRRDKPGEVTRGLFEIPTGKWRAGEDAAAAVRRELREETGLELVDFLHDDRRVEPQQGRPFISVVPVSAAVGVDGAYPTLILAFECVAPGEPLALPGATREPRWYSRREVDRLLADPGLFTGPTFAILSRRAAAG